MGRLVNPPYPPMTTEQLDHSFDLPYTRLPHPKYRGKRIPAYEMIKFSVNIHRGCFGGCAFCTISAHQGKFITCRSKESILREVKPSPSCPTSKATSPTSADPRPICTACTAATSRPVSAAGAPRASIPPSVPTSTPTTHPCSTSTTPSMPCPASRRVSSAAACATTCCSTDWRDEALNRAARDYTRELICQHVSGRLKVAPEHTSDRVLMQMRKPSFQLFEQFKRIFDRINREEHLRQQIIPYFISSHPGCSEADMAELAVITKHLDFQLEQVQDFTPTPMTVATETWYTGFDPYTLQPVFSAKTQREKLAQRQFFFWYKPEERRNIERELRRIGRPDLIAQLYDPSKSGRPSSRDDKPSTAHDHHRTDHRREDKPGHQRRRPPRRS